MGNIVCYPQTSTLTVCFFTHQISQGRMERGTRIELVTLAWKARVIPFYEPRMHGALYEIRTRVPTVKGSCPRPLDEQSKTWQRIGIISVSDC